MCRKTPRKRGFVFFVLEIRQPGPHSDPGLNETKTIQLTTALFLQVVGFTISYAKPNQDRTTMTL